jgi:hypothetical protein
MVGTAMVWAVLLIVVCPVHFDSNPISLSRLFQMEHEMARDGSGLTIFFLEDGARTMVTMVELNMTVWGLWLIVAWAHGADGMVDRFEF